MLQVYDTDIWSTYLRINFDVLFMESELLHIFDSSIMFTKILRLLLLQFVFGRSEVLLRLLHVEVCALSNSQTWFNALMWKDENGYRTKNKNNINGNKHNIWPQRHWGQSEKEWKKITLFTQAVNLMSRRLRPTLSADNNAIRTHLLQ